MAHMNEVLPVEPDFDETPHGERGRHHHGAHAKRANAMTLSFKASVGTVFTAGVVVGVLAMGIPTAYFASRASSGPVFGGQDQAVAAVPGNTAPTPSAPSAAPTPGEVKPVSASDHIRGANNAQVTMIEYSDMECPFCKRFHPTTQQVLKEYDGKVRLVYRHFPLSFHANAQKEAEASECAAELGGNDKFWEYLDKIFERTTSGGTGIAVDSLVPLAKEIGLNDTKFKTCLDSGKYAPAIQTSLSEGQKAGIDGTPGTIFLAKNGKSALVPGAVPYSDLKAEIDKLLK